MNERPSNYWLKKPLNRRTVLRGSAGTALGASALALVGCGGDDDDTGNGNGNGGDPTNTPQGLLPTNTPQPEASPTPESEIQTGGALSWLISTSPPGVDPYTVTSFICSYVNGMSLSKLLRFQAGVPEVEPTDFSMEVDLAQTMPEQPDDLTWTFKVKENAKFHDVDPTNGRAVTSEDVAYAILRYKEFDASVHKSLWSTVERIDTPDDQTVTIHTRTPYADMIQIAGGNLGAYISPKEHAETDEAKTRMVGSGPFIHESFETGVSLKWRANRDYYDAPYPYVDESTAFIVTDQTQRVSQFLSGQVDLTWIHLAEERDSIKSQRPDALFDEQQGIGGYVYMRTDRPPFNDKRVRQAMSMGINRQAIRDAVSNGEGVPDQVVFVGYPFATQVADLGEASKYWEYNPTEARALLDAALGAGETIDTTWDHADAAVYQQAYVDTATLAQASLREVGFNIEDRPAPYAQYISTTYQGQYEGLGHSPRAVAYFLDYLTERLSFANGTRARINLSYVNNPELETLLDKQRQEFDFEARLETIREIEQICAEEQYEVYFSTDTRSYFWDPKVQNYRPSAFFPYTHLMKSWKEA